MVSISDEKIFWRHMPDFSGQNTTLFRYLPKPIKNYLESRGNLSIVAENTTWLLGEKFIRLLLGVLVGAWVARYLGPSQFGQLSYVLAFLAFFQAISGLGIDSIIVRDLSKYPEKSSQLVGSAIVMRAVAGLACWILAVVLMAIFEGFEFNLVTITAIIGSGLLFQATDVFDLWFQSQSLNRLTVTVKLVAYILASTVKVFCILSGGNLVWFAVVAAIEFVLVAGGLYVAYKRNRPRAILAFRSDVAHRIFRESWPLILASLSVIIYMRIDMMMIKSILGEKQVGFYAAALSLSNLWHVIPMSICSSVAPIIAQKKMVSESEYYIGLSNVFRICLAAAIVVCVVVYLCGDYVVWRMFGDAYADAALVLKIHIFTNIPVFLGVARSLWTTNEGKQWFSALCTVAGALASFFLNQIFLHKFGLIGAVYAALGSQMIAAIISTGLLDRRILWMQLGFRPHLLRHDDR
jgi:PST family polysaccharide transporter